MAGEGNGESPVAVLPPVVVPVAPAPAPPSATPTKIEKVPEDGEIRVTKWVLVVIGLVLIALSAAAVWAGHHYGNETTETSTPAPSSAAGTTGATGATGTTGTAGTAAASTVTKKTTTKSFGSDSLLTAGFATGAALVVLGLLYPRLRTLKLPGGVELGFANPDEEEKKKLDQQVDKQVKAGKIKEQDAAAVRQRAETIATAQKVEQLQTTSAWGAASQPSAWGSSGSTPPTQSSSDWPYIPSGYGAPKLSDQQLAESVQAAMAVDPPTSSGDDPSDDNLDDLNPDLI